MTQKKYEIYVINTPAIRRVARIFLRGEHDMEGPKVPSEAQRREAPKRREEWGLRRGAVAPPQYGGLGA